MKNTKTAALAGLILLLTVTMSVGQTSRTRNLREVRKMQYERSWEYYQKNWYKDEKSRLRRSKKDARQQGNLANASDRKVEKLAKLRSQISKSSARKEASND